MSMMNAISLRRYSRGVACVLVGVVVSAGCIVRTSNLPPRESAGVLTTSEGTMYMVLDPCLNFRVDLTSLMYVPPGTEIGRSGDFSEDVVVLSYRAVPSLAPRAVLAPLAIEHGPLMEGLELVERNDDLLKKALTSEETDTYDDRFYVRVDGRNPDGSSRSVFDGWYSTLSKPDTVVLDAEVLDNPEGRYCTLDGARVGWDL